MTRLSLLALLFTFVGSARALTITVAAGKEKCMYFDVGASSQKVYGSFQVASGGFLDIDLKVSGPTGVTGYTALRKTNDRFSFVATESGEWSACFGNSMSTMSSKTVSFTFRVGEGYGDGTDILATKQEIKPIETHVLKLAEELLSIQETQRYSNVRERAHRDSEFMPIASSLLLHWHLSFRIEASPHPSSNDLYLRPLSRYSTASFLTVCNNSSNHNLTMKIVATESTNDRVKWFSVGEFIVLILTNVWQIYTIRQRFESRSRI